MTLISNKYKFIYIKTHRTSSTATQSFLKQFCDEIYTQPSFNVKKGDIYNHSTATEIKNYLYNNNRHEIWDTYKKITIIRNPYSLLYSFYGWNLIRNKTNIKNCNNFITENIITDFIGQNVNKITIDDKSIIDYFIIYENYDKTINNILKKLNINFKYISKNKIIEYISPHNSDNYKSVFNENLFNLINSNNIVKKYINITGYSLGL